MELRQQLEGERDRFRGDPRRGMPGGSGPGAAPGFAPPGHGMPGYGPPPAHGGQRMSPEERRTLRQELRRQRP